MFFSLIIFLSGFTDLVEKVPAPKRVPKRTEDRNAGIVLPAFDCTPYDIIEKSYDPLDAFMYDSEKGIFMSLSTSNFDLSPHKLTFYHKKFGFVTHNAYRVGISFFDKKKMDSFHFSPFEITEPKIASEVIPIAESWIKFFDSLGWKRAKEGPLGPYRILPKCEKGDRTCNESKIYMKWKNDGLQMSISIGANNHHEKDPSIPRYKMKIVFSNVELIQSVLDQVGKPEN
jgi:hypothetical protein